MRYTPEHITTLEAHQVFVFGSNPEGRHSKGAALQAFLSFDAERGNPMGMQGMSYAIITKELRIDYDPIQLATITFQVANLFLYATHHPDLEFLVVKIGCSLAGFTEHEIRHAFQQAVDLFGSLPSNVILPKAFH